MQITVGSSYLLPCCCSEFACGKIKNLKCSDFACGKMEKMRYVMPVWQKLYTIHSTTDRFLWNLPRASASLGGFGRLAPQAPQRLGQPRR